MVVEWFIQAHHLAQIDELAEVIAAVADRRPDVGAIGQGIACPPGQRLIQLAGRCDILLQFLMRLAKGGKRLVLVAGFSETAL